MFNTLYVYTKIQSFFNTNNIGIKKYTIERSTILKIWLWFRRNFRSKNYIKKFKNQHLFKPMIWISKEAELKEQNPREYWFDISWRLGNIVI